MLHSHVVKSVWVCAAAATAASERAADRGRWGVRRRDDAVRHDGRLDTFKPNSFMAAVVASPRNAARAPRQPEPSSGTSLGQPFTWSIGP